MVFYLQATIIYILLSYLFLKIKPAKLKKLLFCLVNLYFTYYLFFAHYNYSFNAFLSYVVLLCFYYVLIILYVKNCNAELYWLAFLMPIIWMIFTKVGHWQIFIGVSYMAFRVSYLVFELQTEKVTQAPSLIDYLTFTMYTPTFLMGPISPYQYYYESINEPNGNTNKLNALIRILFGVCKFVVFAGFFESVGLNALMLDGYYHSWVFFLAACIFPYLFLYLNFSGFCDIVIGVSSFIGIRVKENFNSPLLALNIQDYWTRWHISLSEYMKEIVFTPLTISLCRLFPWINMNHLMAVSIFVTFLLIGVWHGIGWNYVLLGCLHAVELIINHYYSVFLKSLNLNKKTYELIFESFVYKLCSISITFIYISLVSSLFFFDKGTNAELLTRVLDFELPETAIICIMVSVLIFCVLLKITSSKSFLRAR